MPNLTVNMDLPELQTLLELGDMELAPPKVHQPHISGHISYSEELRLAGFSDTEPPRDVQCRQGLPESIGPWWVWSAPNGSGNKVAVNSN